MNQIVIHGRFTKDPEVAMTSNSVSVVDFSIACERAYAKGSEKTTDFIPCRAWRNTADFIGKYFNKGSEAVVYGELHVEKFTTQDGQNRTKTYVLVNNIEFSGSKASAEKEETVSVNDDDLPF